MVFCVCEFSGLQKHFKNLSDNINGSYINLRLKDVILVFY